MTIRSFCGDGRRITLRRRGLTLIEVLAVLMLLGFVLAMLLPSRAGRGVYSTRLVCAAYIKGLGTACKIYANDYGNAWPVPVFDESQIGRIRYTIPVGGGSGTYASPNRMQPSRGGPNGTTEITTTRALWMLVRSGDVTPRQFTCPRAGNKFADESRIDGYYDFSALTTVSYGYQVPYGPAATRASEAIDPEVPLAADKGPYVDADVATPPGALVDDSAATPSMWAPYNSANHGGEGQNVLYADGHATFERTPLAGIDDDNIYTAQRDNTALLSRAAGRSPWVRDDHPFAPRDAKGEPVSTTDSLIFP